jgi:hypothetical protein
MDNPSGLSTELLEIENSSNAVNIERQLFDTRHGLDVKLRFPLQIDSNARSDQDDEFDNFVIDVLDAQFRGTLRFFRTDEDSSPDRFPKEEGRSGEFSSCSESCAGHEGELLQNSSKEKDGQTCEGGKKENAELQ